MGSSPFIDLKDEIALRRFLTELQEGLATTNYLLQSSGIVAGSLPNSMSAVIQEKIRAMVKEFDASMWSTINEVTTNLKLLIPDYEDIVETVVDELGVTSSDLTASVKNTALVAIAEDGTWATAQSVNTLSSTLSTNYATVTELAATYATQTAVGAIYEVGVEANGHVSGYRSVATGQSSVFQIYAEKFAVSSSSTEEGYSPFQIDTVNHKINMTSDVAIDGHLLVSGTVTTPAIALGTGLVNGYIQSSDFTGIGGAGFRLKAIGNTYNDPTIYGAYIRGAYIGASYSIVGGTKVVKSEGTNSGNFVSKQTAEVATSAPGSSAYTSNIRVYSESYGSGYLSNRILNTGQIRIVTFSKVAAYHIAAIAIERSIDGGTWSTIYTSGWTGEGGNIRQIIDSSAFSSYVDYRGKLSVDTGNSVTVNATLDVTFYNFD